MDTSGQRTSPPAPQNNDLSEARKLIATLRQIPFLRTLPPNVMKAIYKQLRVVSFEKDKIIFHEGDEGDSLYLVHSGRIEIVSERDGEERVLNYIGPGGWFGELALLGRGKRAATARVSVDARLIVVGRAEVEEILQRYPPAALTLLRETPSYIKARSRHREYQVIAVVGGSAVDLAESLTRQASQKAVVYRLPDTPAEPALPGGPPPEVPLIEAEPDITADGLAEIIGILVDGFDKVFIQAPADPNAASVKAVELADLTVIWERTNAPWVKVATQWTIISPLHRDARKIDTLARKIARRVVGLALSSGNARSIAHIGVLKVLEEAGIPIDMIAGTSGGALFGGLYAAGLDLDFIARFARRLPNAFRIGSREFNKVFDLNLALRSGLLKGEKIIRWLDEIIGHKSFSELHRPLYIVSADLITGEEVVLHHGSVARAIRASLSNELFVPASINGRYLIDGAAVNPLPTSVLARRGADIIIACNVIPALEARIHRKAMRESRRLPNLLDQIWGKGEIMESEIVKRNLQQADIAIVPDVGIYNASEFHRAEEFLRLGEEATREKLADLKQLTLPTPDVSLMNP
ncbi:MAG: cyclic nucleotide-binding domain-containing protein [Anaerolineae bacterium]